MLEPWKAKMEGSFLAMESFFTAALKEARKRTSASGAATMKRNWHHLESAV